MVIASSDTDCEGVLNALQHLARSTPSLLQRLCATLGATSYTDHADIRANALVIMSCCVVCYESLRRLASLFNDLPETSHERFVVYIATLQLASLSKPVAAAVIEQVC